MKRKGKSHTGVNHWNATPVYCIEHDTIYPTIEDAKIAIDPEHHKANVTATCDGTYKQTKGCRCRYVFDHIKNDGTVIPGAITLGLITQERYDMFVQSNNT